MSKLSSPNLITRPAKQEFVPHKSSFYPQPVVYVLGGGPSLKGFDFNRLRDKFVIGCNDAYKLGEDIVQVCFWGDKGWWKKHKDRVIQRYKGLVISTNGVARKDEYTRYIGRNKQGLFLSDQGIGWNFSSGAASTNLALQFGARTVVLLGFDMGLAPDGTANWHPNEVSCPNANSYLRFLRGFRFIRDDLPRIFPGCCIINANPRSNMEYFPQMELDEALECY